MLDVTFTTVLYEPDWSRTGAIVRDVLGSLEACSLNGELVIIDNPEARKQARIVSKRVPSGEE